MDERTLEQLTDELSAQISMMGGMTPSDEYYNTVLNSVTKLYAEKTKIESIMVESEQRAKKEEHDYEIERLKLEMEQKRQEDHNEIERLKLEADKERQKNEHLDITLKQGGMIMLGLINAGITIWGALKSWDHEEFKIYDKVVEKAFIGRLFRK